MYPGGNTRRQAIDGRNSLKFGGSAACRLDDRNATLLDGLGGGTIQHVGLVLGINRTDGDTFNTIGQ